MLIMLPGSHVPGDGHDKRPLKGKERQGNTMLKGKLIHAVILASLVAQVFLAGCGQNMSLTPVVHAAAPYVGCADVAGKFGNSQEFPGSQIELVDYACQLENATLFGGQTLDQCGHDQVVTQNVTADFHVTAIRLWIGADTNTLFETGSCLEIIPPAGLPGYRRFIAEWDKHIEGHYPDTPFPVDFIIPAGSVVKLSRTNHGVIKCNDIDANNNPLHCLTQEGAALYGQ